jgi:hypothetical protein
MGSSTANASGRRVGVRPAASRTTGRRTVSLPTGLTVHTPTPTGRSAHDVPTG